MNYDNYHLSVKEQGKVLGISAIVTWLVARLFYDSYLPFLAYPFFLFLFWKQGVAEGKQRQKQRLSAQFLDALRTVNTALNAGMAVENAWKEAKQEVALLHGRKSAMYKELEELERELSMSKTVEEWLLDFGERSRVESIQSFADVFSYAKRSGGNLSAIVARTTAQMREKQDTEAEIQVMVANRRLEQKIMETLPLFMLAYLKISSAEYMGAMYGNWLGISIMTACLGVYAVSIYLANRILCIEV